jgi:hypothetical protein
MKSSARLGGALAHERLAVLAAKVHILGQDLDRLQPPQRQTRPGDLKAP